MKKWSKTVKAAVIGALIGVVGSVVVAIITGGFGLLKSSGPATTVETGDQRDGSFSIIGDIVDSTVNVNISPSETEKTIEAPEDLDQSTSGIEKLPDSRTRIGNFVTGSPTFVLDEHESAVTFYRRKDFANALDHSEHAIQAYEETQQVMMKMKARITVGGNLNKSAVAKIYYLGALSAHKLKKHEQAFEWAEKANNHESNPQLIAFLAVTLYNVNRKAEALQVVDKQLVQDPNSPILVNLRGELSKRIMAPQGTTADQK